ncbi:hypothetical protein AAG906_006692 [Vitis piasezkii]
MAIAWPFRSKLMSLCQRVSDPSGRSSFTLCRNGLLQGLSKFQRFRGVRQL